MPPGSLPLEVFQGRPYGGGTMGKSNSLMEWDCLGEDQIKVDKKNNIYNMITIQKLSH